MTGGGESRLVARLLDRLRARCIFLAGVGSGTTSIPAVPGLEVCFTRDIGKTVLDGVIDAEPTQRLVLPSEAVDDLRPAHQRKLDHSAAERSEPASEMS
jgi:hypothetical protein